MANEWAANGPQLARFLCGFRALSAGFGRAGSGVTQWVDFAIGTNSTVL